MEDATGRSRLVFLPAARQAARRGCKGDFYTEIVLPRLQERLDRAFPEFGWKPDRLGWVATNEEHTHASVGVRAEFVAHGPAPRGFFIHGGEAMLWTAYVNGGVTPRGADFVRAVEDIGERAGVDLGPLDQVRPHDRRAELLCTFFDLCQRELIGDGGAKARAYLRARDFPTEAIEESGLGIVPTPKQTREVLTRAGHDEEEIAQSGVLADSRWPGRLCGAWRNEYGRVGTLWARTLSDSGAGDTRYLYLRGASRGDLPPYGLSDVLAGSRELRRDVVLVEGVMDLHQLRAHGFDNVAALGGLGIQVPTFERLVHLGVERLTLCFDRDDPGRAATARAVARPAGPSRVPRSTSLMPIASRPRRTRSCASVGRRRGTQSSEGESAGSLGARRRSLPGLRRSPSERCDARRWHVQVHGSEAFQHDSPSSRKTASGTSPSVVATRRRQSSGHSERDTGFSGDASGQRGPRSFLRAVSSEMSALPSLVPTSSNSRPRNREVPRLALSADEAAAALGVSRDFLDEHIASELRWIRRGRRKLVALRELERWLTESARRPLEDEARLGAGSRASATSSAGPGNRLRVRRGS